MEKVTCSWKSRLARVDGVRLLRGNIRIYYPPQCNAFRTG
jgi:hypothetical protein